MTLAPPEEPSAAPAAGLRADAARHAKAAAEAWSASRARWQPAILAAAASGLSSVRAAARLAGARLAATGRGLRPAAGRLAGIVRALRPRHALYVATAGLVGLLGYLAYCLATLPINGGLVVEATPSALVLEADNGQVFATRGVFKGDKLAAGDLPPHLARAVVAIEDRRFYDHFGVDVRGLFRAAWRNARAGGTREGGSTLTQQLARMMYLSQDRTLKRKIQEAMLAVWLERQLGKEEILVRYLNTAYFGAGAYGVDAAAKRYFGKRAKELTLPESAMLAGLVRAPSQLAPHRNFEGARERADLVLQAMIETGAITPEDQRAARTQPAALRLPPEAPPGSNYFTDVVGGDVKRLLGTPPADLTLRTTLDLELQKLAEEVVAKRLDAEGARKNAGQAALVALAPDGAILALVGGRDYEASQFNRVTQAKRQAGSLFKLFVYLAAFEKGLSPDSTFVDRPTQIGDWEPQNASGRFRGAVTLRSAFALSINTIAAQLADQVGIPTVIATAKRLGVQSDLPTLPSLALGAAEVTLLEMTRAYGAVATGVPGFEPFAVRTIGAREQPLYTRPAASPPATNDPNRAAMVDLLAAVVREGTGRAARLSQPAAGKTGTTQEYRDAWFVGFTSDVIVGVWTGNDDNEPMNQVAGGDLPATIWRDFVSAARPILARRKGPVVASRAPASPPAPGALAATGAQLAAEPALRGVPVVLDTGTIDLRGRTVRLFGVEGEGGRSARELARFLRGREVSCEPVSGAESQRCMVNGSDDLAETILLNGAARASAEASPELVAAEERAKMERVGVWRRGR